MLDARRAIAATTRDECRRQLRSQRMPVQAPVGRLSMQPRKRIGIECAGLGKSPYEREMRAALTLWADHVRALVEGGEKKILPLRA